MLVQASTKNLRKQGIQNICLQEFPILLALNFYAFMCTYDFYQYQHVYTYRFSKNIGKQEKYVAGLNSCYLFNIEHETEHDIDSVYGVCMHSTFLNFTTDEFDSLLVCNIITFFFNCLWGGKFLTWT